MDSSFDLTTKSGYNSAYVQLKTYHS